MERSFPSRFELEFLSTQELATLLMAALVVAVSFAGLVWTVRRKPSRSAVLLWFLAGILYPILFVLALQVFQANWRHSGEVKPWLVAAFVISMFTSIVGAIVANSRLEQSGKKSGPLRLVAAAVAFIFVVGLVWLPALNGGGRISPRAECRNNLWQIGLALQNYHESYNTFPASRISTPPVSWRVQTLPFLDQASLYEEYVPKKAWDSAANLPIAQTRVPTFECPSRALHGPTKDDLGRRYTDYIMLTGEGTFSLPNKPLRKRDLLDGESNTLAVTEATGLNIVWTEPRDADPTDQPIGINFSGNGRYDSTGIASSWHRSGANALFADGAVRFLSENIDPVVLKSLTTVRGNEDLQGTEF